MRLLATLFISLVTAVAADAGEPVDPGLILTTLRQSVAKGPVAERVRVTIRHPGKSARSDDFLVKVDPGKKPDRSDAAVWIELGDLRVYAAGGRLVAVHTGDETSCYSASFGDRLGPETLRALLPPIPAPLVGLVLGDAGEAPNVSLGLTPYTPRVTWTSAEAVTGAGAQIVTLTGSRDPFPGERTEPAGLAASMVIDARTSRVTRFSAVLPDAAELRLEITPTVPGNPATWPIRFERRATVASLTDLRERRGDAAAANVVPELTLMDATWSNWNYRSVFRGPAGATPTHLALIFMRETTRDAFGAPSADVKAAEDELRRLSAELAAGADSKVRLAHLTAPVMLTMDENSRRKVENAVKLRESTAPEGAPRGNIIWAASPERTIERFAPGAAAVAVVIRADNSLAGIVLLDGRAKEGKSLRQDFRRALGLEAAEAGAK